MFSYLEEIKKERERQENIEKAKQVAIGTVIGMAVGASIGILLAPKSGEETREEILARLNKNKEELQRELKEKTEAAKEWKEKLDRNIEGSIDEVKYRMDRFKEEELAEEDKENALEVEVEEIIKNKNGGV